MKIHHGTKRAQSTTKGFLLSLVSLILTFGCSRNDYSSPPPPSRKATSVKSASEGAKPSQTPRPGDENVTPPGFLQAGKSLDLYVIMDKSGSLFKDPMSPLPGTGSDPNCKRFDGLLDLVDSLKTKLKANEEVRLTVVTFAEKRTLLGSLENVLKLSRDDVSNKFRFGTCNTPDGTTNYAEGIEGILSEFAKNSARKKLDLESVVFFSDGAAKDDENTLRAAIDKLNNTFPRRTYGVLLGQTNDTCSLTGATGSKLSTADCMALVVGADLSKVLKVGDANGLSEALSGLINK